MKNYNEMAEAVFRRRDEILTARKKRTALLLKTAGSLCAVLLVAVVGISLWKHLPDVPYVEPTAPVTSATETNLTDDTQYTENTNDIQTTPEVTEPVSQNTKVPVLPYDPTEPSASKPDGGFKPTGKPSTNPTAATDPTEELQDPTAGNISTEPPWNEAPVQPQPPIADPTEPPWAEPPTQEPWEPPTECPTAEPADPTEEPVAPTEPPMSELYIECGGETLEAEIGDVVTVTVEMQSPELLKDIAVVLRYDDFSGYLKLVNEIGLTTYEKNALHVPNIDPDYVYVNYKYNKDGKKGIKVLVDGEYEDFDFSEKKIFFTFSFDVREGGFTSIELMLDTITGVSGEPVNPASISLDMHISKK